MYAPNLTCTFREKWSEEKMDCLCEESGEKWKERGNEEEEE